MLDRDQIKEIFLQALELPPGRERESFVERVCAQDPEGGLVVKRFLAQQAESESFFSSDPAQHLAASDSWTGAIPVPSAPCEGPGTVIDRYELLEQIGEGGFGVVYRAKQRAPVMREVALKILKPGMDTRQVMARFEAERQALARMEHPHIAQVFDGGTHRDRPYFVMELVRGVPLTQFCEEERLGVLDRLRLFQKICSAIQHAHQKGIIHRDLKPSNVLVTRLEDRPVPKVIDFGIAKATQGSLTDKTVFTRALGFLGTPGYMSPEQAASSGADLDTRSDIYGLGILLYELITGTPPFDSDSLLQGGYERMLRTIREVDPPRPSWVLKQHRNPRCRGHTTEGPRDLAISRELDWIVMKAMEKDRDRRYESALELSRDLDRYLNHEPVTAVAMTTRYLVRKLVRRHRTPLLVASAIVISLAIGTIASLREAARARRQAVIAESKSREAQDILRFFEQKILVAPRPALDSVGGLGMDTTLREAIAAAEPDVAKMFRDRPLVEASIRYTLAETYRMLNDPKAAIPQFEAALRLRRERLGPEHPDTLQVMEEYASALKDDSRNEEATQLLATLLEVRRRVLGPVHPVTVRSMFVLAWQYAYSGHGEKAFSLYRETLETCRRTWGEEHRTTLDALKCLARTGDQTGRKEEARRLREEILAVRTRVHGSEDPDTILAQLELARSYDACDLRERAVRLLEEAFERCRRVLGERHLYTHQVIKDLAESYHQLGRAREAAVLYDSEVVLLRRLYGADHAMTLQAMSLLAGYQADCGRPEEAEELRRQVLEAKRRVLGADHPETLLAEQQLHAVSSPP